MPRGIQLNDIEKGRIMVYKEDRLSKREIAQRLGKSILMGRAAHVVDKYVVKGKRIDFIQ